MAMTKLVVIESPGKIAALGGIVGPIRTPSKISTDVLIGLVNDGKIVYELNPANHSERVRLTRMNMFTNNFKNSVKQVIKLHKKVVEETIKAETVNVKPAMVTPSTPSDTIVKETGEGMIGTDVFQSNTKSGKKNK